MGLEDRQTSENAPASSDAAAPPPTSGVFTNEDDILQVLTEFEAGLESLKSLYVQRQTLQHHLREQQGELQRRESELHSKVSETERARLEAEALRREIESSRAQLQASHAEMQAQREALEQDRIAWNDATQAQTAQHQAMGDALIARQHELDTRAAKLEQAWAAHRTAQKAFDADSTAREKSLRELADRVAADKAAHEQWARALEDQGGSLDARQHSLDARDTEVAARQAELDSRSGQLEALSRELGDQRADLERQRAELGSHRSDLEAAQQELAQAQSTLTDARKAFVAERASLDAARAAMDERLAEVSETEKDLTLRAAALDERVNTLTQLESALAERDAAVEERARGVAARESAAVDNAPEIARLSAEIERIRVDHAQTLALADKRSVLIDQLQQRMASAAADLRALKELRESEQSARQDAQSLREQLDAARADLSRVQTDQTASIDHTRESIHRLTEVLEEYESLWTLERVECARVSVELAQSRTDLAELEGVLDKLRARLKSEVAARESLNARIRELEEPGAAQPADAAPQSVPNPAREAELEALRRELEASASRITLLEQQLASARASAPPRTSSEASMLRRRQRLKLAHMLIREQSKKLRKGGDALKKRYEQCEQILSQRAELAQVRQRLIEADRSQQARRGATRAAVVSMCSAAALAILFGLSWAVAREVAPAVFEASSTIQADGRGRELNEAELAEWTRFHVDLLKDPRFHETAAERFKRQNSLAYSTPTGVFKLVEESVTTESVTPGQMHIRMTGQGAQRTARSLETFTAALASHANAMEGSRIDGASTGVAEPAVAGAEPLDSSRMVYALAMFAGGTFFMTSIAIIIWRRLSRAKTDFERDSQLSLLDEHRWPNPGKAA